MQQFKATKNIEIERQFARKLEKQRGDIPFELESNISGRITTTFANAYTELPFINITLMVIGDGEFDVSAVLTARTKTDFTISVINTGSKPVKGIIMWFAK